MRTLALLAALCSCTAYRTHPVQTLAVSTLAASGIGAMCIGIGECGGDNGNSWQNDAAHYGAPYLGEVLVIGAVLWLGKLEGWTK